MASAMTLDDEDAFLYGDEDEEVSQAAAPAVIQEDALAKQPATANNAGDNEDGEDVEDDEDDESDDDLEIILDTEPGTVPVPPPPKRPLVPVPTLAAVQKPSTTDSVKDASAGDAIEAGATAPEEEEGAVKESAEAKPVGLVPLGSLVPLTSYPLVELDPTIDVNAVQKDEFGNDLFDVDIDTLEEKPWRQPGANMADYFNYGMNESAWKNYALKQRRTRLTEKPENNPYAAFATGNLQEAWQGLAPEHKATMMAAIMGFQPPPGGAPGMMGMMGGMSGPMGGMPAMTGMGGMMGGAGGFGMNGMSGMGGNGGFSAPMDMYGGHGTGNAMEMMEMSGLAGGFDSPHVDTEAGLDLKPEGFESQYSATGANDIEGAGTPLMEGASNGQIGNNVPKGPRAAPPSRPVPTGPRAGLAGNIPTGPRKQAPPPTGPRRDRAYQDKDRDRIDRGSDGLDYGVGGAADDQSGRPSLPPPRGSGRDADDRNGRRESDRDSARRSTDRQRERERERDRERDKERDRESRDSERRRDRDGDSERRSTTSRGGSPRERRGERSDRRRTSREDAESTPQPAEDAPIKLEEDPALGLKIRGVTKAKDAESGSPETGRRARRPEDEPRSSRRSGHEEDRKPRRHAAEDGDDISRQIEEKRRSRRHQWGSEDEEERPRKRTAREGEHT